MFRIRYMIGSMSNKAGCFAAGTAAACEDRVLPIILKSKVNSSLSDCQDRTVLSIILNWKVNSSLCQEGRVLPIILKVNSVSRQKSSIILNWKVNSSLCQDRRVLPITLNWKVNSSLCQDKSSANHFELESKLHCVKTEEIQSLWTGK